MADPITPADLARLREICAAATPGPWELREDYDYYDRGTYIGTRPYHWENGGKVDGRPSEHPEDCYFAEDVCRIEHGRNTEFILAAREWLPRLIEAYDELRGLDESLHSGCTLTVDHPTVVQLREARAEVERLREDVAAMKALAQNWCDRFAESSRAHVSENNALCAEVERLRAENTKLCGQMNDAQGAILEAVMNERDEARAENEALKAELARMVAWKATCCAVECQDDDDGNSPESPDGSTEGE